MRQRDLTKGNLWKQVIVFSLPLILSNVLQIFFNMADVAVAGRFAGTIALGAVGSCTQLVFFFTAFVTGMGGGVNALVARYFGAREEKSVREMVHTSLLVCLGIGLVLLVLGEILSVPMLLLLGTKEALIDGAKLYLRIYFLGVPAMAVYNFGNGVFSAVGDTRKPLIFLLTAGIINVALNLFFVITLGKDVDGVAWASVISQYISAFLIIISLLRTRDSYGIVPGEIRLNRMMAKRVIAIGIPAGFQYAIFALANMFIQSGVNHFDEAFVAGNTAENNLDNIMYDSLGALYTATSSFIGQNYGAGNRQRMRKTYLVTTIYGLALAAVVGVVYSVFGRTLLGLFTTDPAVVEAGMIRLKIVAACYWISVFMDNATAACRGLGKSFVPTIVVIMGSCVFRIVWIYTVFAAIGTPASLYLLYAFSWVITALAQNGYLLFSYRKITRNMIS